MSAAPGARVWEVLARECPAAIRQARVYVAIACLTFLLPAAAGYLLMREQPALALDLLPEVMIERADAGAERMAEGRRYVDVALEDRPLMASGIITNNVRVAIACFAGGIFLGVGSLVLLGYNGLSIGAAAGHFANRGLLGYLLEFILGHGLLELFAIWVAGAAGVPPGAVGGLTGRPEPERCPGGERQDWRCGWSAAAAVLLVVAGLIEGFVSAGDGNVAFRAAASVGSLAFLAAYLRQRTKAAVRLSRSDFPEHPPHADGHRLDLPEAGQGLGVELRLVEQQQLDLGQEGREGVGEVVPELAHPFGFGHVGVDSGCRLMRVSEPRSCVPDTSASGPLDWATGAL